MQNQFTVVTTRSFGQRILGSIVGIPIGLLLIIGGITLLYWNEGRYDLAKLAKQAVEIQVAQGAPAGAQGQLVTVQGNITSDEQLGDTFLKPGDYLALTRTSEQYAWKEQAESQTQGNTGGSETTTTTYTYTKEWTENPAPSSSFARPEGRTNPPKAIPSATKTVQKARIGDFSLEMGKIDLPSSTSVALTSENILPVAELKLAEDNYLYKGDPFDPKVGDVRIRYGAVANKFNGTVFGKLNGTSIGPFLDQEDRRLYRLFSGNKEEAIAMLRGEYRMALWMFRAIGFLGVFIGLTMLLGPITTLLSFFPTLGMIGGAVVATIAFPVALLLSTVTILVGMIARNPIALIGTLILAVAASAYYIRRRGAKVARPTASPPVEPVSLQATPAGQSPATVLPLAITPTPPVAPFTTPPVAFPAPLPAPIAATPPPQSVPQPIPIAPAVPLSMVHPVSPTPLVVPPRPTPPNNPPTVPPRMPR